MCHPTHWHATLHWRATSLRSAYGNGGSEVPWPLGPNLVFSACTVLWYFSFCSEQTFDVFGYGQQVMSNHQQKNELEDRLHYFLEECDHLQVRDMLLACLNKVMVFGEIWKSLSWILCLQGMHLLVDSYNGFGGVASSIVQDLYDDYSGKSIAIFPVSPPSFPNSVSGQRNSARKENTSRSFLEGPPRSIQSCAVKQNWVFSRIQEITHGLGFVETCRWLAQNTLYSAVVRRFCQSQFHDASSQHGFNVVETTREMWLLGPP